MNGKSTKIKIARIVLNVTFMAMLASICFYILIALVVTSGAVRSGRPPMTLAPVVWIILITVAAIAFFTGLILPNLIMKEKMLAKAGSKAAAFTLIIGISIAAFAMMDFAAAMGVAATFMTMSPKFVYPNAAIAALGMFIVRSRCAEWIDKVETFFPMDMS